MDWRDKSDRPEGEQGEEGSDGAGLTPRRPAYRPYVPDEDGPITPELLQQRLVHLSNVTGVSDEIELSTAAFAAHLTVKQQKYGQKLLEVGPDRWREAARHAGYADGADRRKIEESPYLIEFMAALRHEIALHQALSIQSVHADIHRIGRKAEAVGDYGVALRAAKLKGDIVGAFHESDDGKGGININGQTIIIQSGRTKEDDAAEDAVYREILEDNERGWQRPDPEAPTLPGRTG